MKITKVICGLLTGLVIFLAIPIDASAAYKKDCLLVNHHGYPEAIKNT